MPAGDAMALHTGFVRKVSIKHPGFLPLFQAILLLTRPIYTYIPAVLCISDKKNYVYSVLAESDPATALP